MLRSRVSRRRLRAAAPPRRCRSRPAAAPPSRSRSRRAAAGPFAASEQLLRSAPVPPADYAYGPAAYVIGERETPAGPVPRSLSAPHACRPSGHLAHALGHRARRLPRASGPLRPRCTGSGQPRPGHGELQAHARRAPQLAPRHRRVAPRRGHEGDQRLVRRRQRYLLGGGGGAHGRRDAPGGGRRPPAPRPSSAGRARSRGAPRQRALRLPRDVRTGAGDRPARVPGRRHEGRSGHAHHHLRRCTNASSLRPRSCAICGTAGCCSRMPL